MIIQLERSISDKNEFGIGNYVANERKCNAIRRSITKYTPVQENKPVTKDINLKYRK